MKHEPNMIPERFEDDPRLSAYALGELDAAERAAVEALLESEPDARAFVAELRETAAVLGAGLGTENAPGLTDTQRAVIEKRAAARVAPTPILQFASYAAAGLAAGALFWLGVEVFDSESESPRGDGTDAAADYMARADDPLRESRAADEALLGSMGYAGVDGAIREAETALADEKTRAQTERDGLESTVASLHNDVTPIERARLESLGYGGGDEDGLLPDTIVVARTGAQPDISVADLNGLGTSSATPGAGGGGGGTPLGSLGYTATGSPDDTRFDFGLAADGDSRPYFRAFSTGGVNTSGDYVLVDPDLETTANGGFDPASVPVPGTPGAPRGNPGATGSDDFWLGHGEQRVVVGGSFADTGNSRESETKTRARRALESLGYYEADSDVEVLDELRSEYRGPADEIPRRGVYENPFRKPEGADAFSTFSIDVDTASYANMRGFLERGGLPPANQVRIEELVNYFPYSYAPPTGEHPFAVHVEVGQAPWHPTHRLLRVGIKAREVERAERQPSNIVFLLDVSGSMSPANKLPLLKSSMEMLVGQLDERDHVGIVTYAGTSGVHLGSTNADQKDTLLQSIRALRSGGSTNGEAGLQLAYQMAEANMVEGVNRVILATDGDFNVGVSSDSALTAMIGDKAKSGVFLTVLGFGTGNFQDAKLEAISGRGNGTFHYIDSQLEAKKVLVDGLTGTLETVAKDVKIQLDFNPLEVAAYRLLGYENRVLANKDFLDDSKDAGEVGAGHQVTAIYEIVPAGADITADAATPGVVEPSRYRVPAEDVQPEPVPEPETVTSEARTGELLTVRLRYKQPEGSESTGFEVHVKDDGKRFAEMSVDARFASAVTAFGMLLRGSRYSGSADMRAVFDWAMNSTGDDPSGYRREFLKLVEKAKNLRGGR